MKDKKLREFLGVEKLGGGHLYHTSTGKLYAQQWRIEKLEETVNRLMAHLNLEQVNVPSLIIQKRKKGKKEFNASSTIVKLSGAMYTTSDNYYSR